MAIEVLVRSHVATGRARIGVADRVLDVLQRHAGVVEAGGKGVPEAVRADLARGLEARPAGEAADQPPGLRFIHPPALVVDEQRPGLATTNVGVEGALDGRGQRLERVAAALAADAQDAVAELVAEVLDVSAERLGDAQAVVGPAA
jgi:hypothetical protein